MTFELKRGLATISASGVLLLVLSTAIGDAQESTTAPIPDWYSEAISRLTSGSGRWVADNSSYKSAQEPFDAYATHWRSSFDGTSMTGTLYGVIDGEDVTTFWEFREFWHPGRREVILQQFGTNGMVGIGTSWHEDGKSIADQEFFNTDGSSMRTGHRSWFPNPDTHVTHSFDIVDGNWQARRQYTWQRQ